MATTAASEPTPWRAGAASVLSEAVGAADAVGAGVDAECGPKISQKSNQNRKTAKRADKRQASRPEYSLGNKDQTVAPEESHPARRASWPTAAQRSRKTKSRRYPRSSGRRRPAGARLLSPMYHPSSGASP